MHRSSSAIALTAMVLASAAAPLSAAEIAQLPLTTPGQSSAGSPGSPGVTLAQNVSQVILAGNSVSCPPGAPHADNSYWRRFDLDGDHAITTCFQTTRVDFGIELADAPGGSQPVVVRLYTIPNGSPLLLANLTGIASLPLDVGNQALTILPAPVTATVIDPLLLDLVVEVFTPSGQQAGNRFVIGSNDLGQTAPGYMSAAACGVTEPASTASDGIGFPNMHLYLTVTGAGCLTPSVAQSWGRLKSLYR